MILFLMIFLSLSRIETPQSATVELGAHASISEQVPQEQSCSFRGELIDPYDYAAQSCCPITEENLLRCDGGVFQKVLYFSVGAAIGSVSFLARLGWGLCLISPWASTIGNECLLFCRLCDSLACHAFAQVFKKSHSSVKGIPLSNSSWYLNQKLLSQIPAFSKKDKELLVFLEKRWLAKSTGFFSSIVNWVCPCFGIFVQIHPETTSSYARLPAVKISEAYKNRVEAWKQFLPHPQYFPLILTRPHNLQQYLPSCFEIPVDERIDAMAERLSLKMQTSNSHMIVDVTPQFAKIMTQDEWLNNWETYRVQFLQICKEYHLNLNQILCIQRVQQEEIGGIRILPLTTSSVEELESHHQFLLKWISSLGLAANRIELDRWEVPSFEKKTDSLIIQTHLKDELGSYLDSYDQSWKASHSQKTLMFKGTLQILKGLLANISDDKWKEIMRCPTRCKVVQFSVLKIKEKFELLLREEKSDRFFDTVSHLEQIHGYFSALLEIFSPFTPGNFPSIYQNLLIFTPSNLKPLITYGLHSSGMTSLAGIFKAVEKTVGKTPRVLYGQNTYYECIHTAMQISNASSFDEATMEDWKNVDLILAQFNPVLKRIDLPITAHVVEKIAEILYKCLNVREGKPLTLALDCTLDFIDSPRVGKLLDEFQEYIHAGTLNVISYRSGLKFDLFGMDNYCGAPFYMVHNKDSKWDFFHSLATDPVLQTDRLSLNWFCLAYQCAASYLELYRKQIFDNTRCLLNKIPSRLFDQKNTYRIIPVEQGADAGFIDIKISGPFHSVRGAALVGGCIYLRCMEGKHPIFYRPSIGFYHPNLVVIFGKTYTTVRLTLGLDPDQINLLSQCFEMLDTLNGGSKQILLNKLALVE